MNNDYNVGLDIGKSSVGWAVIDDQYHVVEARGKNLMGVRLFQEASTAENRRMYRTTRRRLSRRRWRIRLLNEIFSEELIKIDPNFLQRLKYSWVHPLDQKNHNYYYGGTIFGNKAADNKFYKKYPTIYHLRLTLMNDDQKHDLREVYIAVHHLIKYRGHFLTGGKINPKNAFDIKKFADNLEHFNETFYPDGDLFRLKNQELVNEKLLNFQITKTQRVEEALKYFEPCSEANKKLVKSVVTAILTGIVGNTVNLINIFNIKSEIAKDEEKDYKFKFSDENIDEELETISGKLNQEENQFINVLREAYDGITLKSILKDSNSLSQAMVQRYKNHHHDLILLKEKFRNKDTKKDFDKAYMNVLSADDKKQSAGKKYFRKKVIAAIEDHFSGELDFNEIKKVLTSNNEKEVAKATTRLVKITEDRVNHLEPNAIKDYQLICLLQDINLDNFLLTQRNKDNGAIPHQLHENELRQIIKKQGKYYPFLNETFNKENKTENKIVGLLTFRVPYYVGPLVEPEKVTGDSSNHWLVRKELGEITPWNLADKVDLDESAKKFIHRLTNKDSFLIKEETLPDNSMIYQKFKVLQELNNVRYSFTSDSSNRRYRLSPSLKQKIFQNLFKTHVNVTASMVEDFILNSESRSVKLYGLSDQHNFNNSLKTYNYFVKIFGREFVERQSSQDLLENIVEIQTIFEDRKLIKHQLKNLKKLTCSQIKQLSYKHYTGWGRLSRKFLTTKKIHTAILNNPIQQDYSIMDLLYFTSNNLMEIINNPKYKVNKWIEEENVDKTDSKIDVYSLIDNLKGSPAIKRGIYQSFRILDDIQRVMNGVAPKNVYLEFARETQQSRITNSRMKRLKSLYQNESIKSDFAKLSNDLEKVTQEQIKDDRLYLYYLQLGKDMYTGAAIDLDQISKNYDIDHIIPRSYKKDDSLNNRVLVNRSENARKSDSIFLKPEVIAKMKPFWSYLLRSNLISQKKFDLLIRKEDFSEEEKKSFIARDLVETRQIIKNVAMMIDQKYDGKTKAVAIRSSLTSDMRRYTHKLKSREINDYHHAHDALMIATVGEYIQKRGFDDQGEFTYEAFDRYNNNRIKEFRKKNSSPNTNELDSPIFQNNNRLDPFGFVVGSMKSPNLIQQTNSDTGEIVWTKDNYNYLLSQLENPYILFTRKIGDSKGKLYNETRYPSSLKDSKTKGKIPFNKNQSVELYGGFDSSQQAYSVLIYYKKRYRLLGIKRAWVAEIQKDKEFIVNKVQEIAPGAKIILDHVPNEQAVIKNGNWMTIGSATELHNAQQLYLPHDLYNNLTIILKASTLEKAQARLKNETHRNLDEIMIEAFDKITQAMEENFPAYHNFLKKIMEYRNEYLKQAFDDKKQFILDVLTGLHANFQSKNLKKVCSDFGRFHSRVGFTLKPDDIFVFNSVSGIYQRKVKVKDLLKIE